MLLSNNQYPINSYHRVPFPFWPGAETTASHGAVSDSALEGEDWSEGMGEEDMEEEAMEVDPVVDEPDTAAWMISGPQLIFFCHFYWVPISTILEI